MSYTSLATLQAELTAVNNAIIALLTGGAISYMLGDRQVTKIDLPKLQEHRKELERQINMMENPRNRLIRTYGVYKSSR
jgi:membrane protein YqaA with SNARE-associated domain